MKLNEYIEQLNKIVDKNPEYGEFPLIYSEDDEGNAYHHVIAGPEATHAEDFDEYYIEIIVDSEDNPNCIIIN